MNDLNEEAENIEMKNKNIIFLSKCLFLKAENNVFQKYAMFCD